MPTTQRNPHYLVSSSIADAITAFLRGWTFKTVHYVGYADEGLIRSLIREARYTLTLADYWDRWNTGKHFFGDGEWDASQWVVPDWLDRIPTYFEGAPRHEVLLQDIPWLEGQLVEPTFRSDPDATTYHVAASRDGEASGLTLRRGRHEPKCIILFGEAPLDTDHPHYDWRDSQSLRIGLRKGLRKQGRVRVQGSLFDD